MWNSSCRGKHKFFFWLLLNDRLNKRNLLRRKTMHLGSYPCVLCNTNQEETLLHLFFDCSFGKWCWRFLNIDWDTQLQPEEMLLRASSNLVQIFREIWMTASWCIWYHRNDIIFDHKTLSLSRWRISFKEEMSLVVLKDKTSVKQPIEEWLCNINL